MADVEPFDPKKRKPGGHAIDLDAPFFEERHSPPREYSKCDHTRLGFQYDRTYRKVYCRCGDEVDAFDAIVALAHSEQRQKWAADVILADQQRKAEEKAKRPFVKKVRGFSHRYDRMNRPIARLYSLECGHVVTQLRGRGFKRKWKTATCEHCYRAAELAKKNIAVVPPEACHS